VLVGNRGRDILIGGAGWDLLFGNSGSDILIGSATIHDADDAALNAIRTEWTSDKSLATRKQNLTDGSGGDALNGSVFLNTAAIIDDNKLDFLFGNHWDWLLN